MNFKTESLKQIKKLVENEDYSYFFENMNKDTLPEEEKIMDKIAWILMYEYNIPKEDFSKIKFFIKLGLFTKKTNE
jgi:hypothetical protein